MTRHGSGACDQSTPWTIVRIGKRHLATPISVHLDTRPVPGPAGRDAMMRVLGRLGVALSEPRAIDEQIRFSSFGPADEK